ncbi:MAG TPA: Trp biosynthesis-associated membrane protein [Nocardioides sp.]|nr:Trp biosynthesis-associated membrane protein [Nocardioides sp.]
MPEPIQGGARRTFGPVVLAGLVTAGATAIAGDRPAAATDGRAGASEALVTYDAHMPLVTALGLVVLACWGVVLVTRGRVRRAVAALGGLAAVGATAAVVAGWSQVPEQLRDELAGVGLGDASVGHTAWFWVAAAAAVLSVLTCAAAVVWVPGWPQMGSRYDAPGAAPAAPAVAPEEQTSLDLWKAIDEGRDPTAAGPE